MQRDGHTHTEFCPHGRIDDTEEVIQQAIQLGFKEYSITEHAPLPAGIEKISSGMPEVWSTASMALNDVDNYFKKMNYLQKKYASDLLIHIGFELDYFADFEEWTTDFLAEYGPQTDDGILSVHFLPGTDGLYGIDYTYEEYNQGIVIPAGGFANAQTLYYQTILRSLEANLGPWKPRRLGHISLVHKFEKQFAESTDFSLENVALVQQLLTRIKEKNYQLDLNTAGFFKAGYQQSYPQPWIVHQARLLNIPLIYGSDTHAVSEVGQGYEKINSLLK